MHTSAHATLNPPSHCYRLLGQVLQKGNHLQELPVGHVVDERHALDSVHRLELVADGGVVDHHDGVQTSSQEPEVLDEDAAGVHAVVAEEACGDAVVGVHHVQEGIGVLEVRGEAMRHDLETRCVHDDLVDLAHASDELQRPWTQIDVHVVVVALDLHGDHVAALLRRLERGVHEGLVQVENERLATAVRRRLLS